MKANFSFNYGEKTFNYEVADKAVYEIENGVSVSVEAIEYPEYNAMEWVMYFENNSSKNTEIFSHIPPKLSPDTDPVAERGVTMPKVACPPRTPLCSMSVALAPHREAAIAATAPASPPPIIATS